MGGPCPPLFGRSANPISTRGGGTLSPPSTTCPPGFSDLATALDGKTEQSDSRSEKSLISITEKFPIYFPEPRFAKNHFDQIKANDKFREKILEKGKFKIRSFRIGCQITWAKYRGKRLNVALQYKLNLSGLVVVVNAIN